MVARIHANWTEAMWTEHSGDMCGFVWEFLMKVKLDSEVLKKPGLA